MEPERIDETAEASVSEQSEVYSREEEEQLASRLQELGYIE